MYSIVDDMSFSDEHFVYTVKNMERTIRENYLGLRKAMFEYLMMNVETIPAFKNIIKKGGYSAIYSLMNKLVEEHNDLGIKGLKEMFESYDKNESMITMLVYSFIHEVIDDDGEKARLFDKYNRFRGDVTKLGNDIISDVKNHITEYEPYFSDYVKTKEEVPAVLH